MTRVVVTDTGQLDFESGLAALRAAGHRADILATSDPAEVAAQAADADALIVSFCPIGADVLDSLPRLRVIATTTVGVDPIDVQAARQRGIDVCNLPSLASEEVAVHALAGILTLVREIPMCRREAAAGSWDFSNVPVPPRASELTLGLFGLGRIAQYLATLAAPLVAQVISFDPFLPDERWPAGVERVTSSEDLFARSNVLSLHAPATADTRQVVNARSLALMPPGSFLVNVARGDLVRTGDLLAAIDAGRLAGAFLDVLDPEPPDRDDPVLNHPRVIVTPHAAFYSAATTREYVMVPVRNVILALSGERPGNIVN